jgi:hypothetical protein
MWGFFALLVIGIGLVWYAGLQPEIPSELSFLKWDHHTTVAAAGDTTVSASSTAAPLGPVTGATGWRLTTDSEGFEYSRDFDGAIRGGSTQYDAPVFGITCYHNVTYVHVDTRLRAAGQKAVKVTFNGDTEEWVRAQGQTLFAPNSAQILKGLEGREVTQMTVGFDEAPVQAFALKLSGLPKILDILHRECALPK